MVVIILLIEIVFLFQGKDKIYGSSSRPSRRRTGLCTPRRLSPRRNSPAPVELLHRTVPRRTFQSDLPGAARPRRITSCAVRRSGQWRQKRTIWRANIALLGQGPSGVSPAPKVYLLCEDPAVIGAPFFLMERRHGVVLRGRGPSSVDLTPDFASRVSRGFMDCFVALHAVDLAANDLLTLGKPEGFLERQVHGWTDRWRRAATDDQPDIDRVIQWLGNRIPRPQAPTLVHNDFKLDNLMLDSNDLGRVEAVLDWEMTTIGRSLADVGLSPVLLGGAARRKGLVHAGSIRPRICGSHGTGCFPRRMVRIAGGLQAGGHSPADLFRWKLGPDAGRKIRRLGEQVQRLSEQSQRLVTQALACA